MSYSYIAQPRLTRIERAVRRANARALTLGANLVYLRNLMLRTPILPLGFPASKVLEQRSR